MSIFLIILFTTLSFGNTVSELPDACLASLCGGGYGGHPTGGEQNVTVIKVQSGDKVTLECETGDSYSWIEPFIEKFRKRPDHDLQKYKIDLSKKTYVVENITYAYAGHYSCLSTNTSVAVIKLYFLYVNDKNVLSLTNTRKFSADVLVSKESIANIPCIPTSEDVNVDLFIDDFSLQNKIPMNTLLEGRRTYTYDPRTGFYTNDTNFLGIRYYTCKFSNGDKEETLTSRFVVTPNHFSVPYTYITTESSPRDRIIVECRYNGDEKYPIEWITPQNSSDPRINKFVFTETIDSHNYTVNRFVVSEANEQDKGYYYCKTIKNDKDFFITNILISDL